MATGAIWPVLSNNTSVQFVLDVVFSTIEEGGPIMKLASTVMIALQRATLLMWFIILVIIILIFKYAGDIAKETRDCLKALWVFLRGLWKLLRALVPNVVRSFVFGFAIHDLYRFVWLDYPEYFVRLSYHDEVCLFNYYCS
jgi:hypothetical protein